MEFFSAFKRPKTKPNNPGNPIIQNYIEKYKENGEPYLEPTDTTDLYALAQTHKDECDIHILIARFAADDKSILNNAISYADTTKMPKTITEYMNHMSELERQFAQMSPEIRKKFNNDFKQYASSAGTEDWYKALGYERSDKKNIKTEKEEYDK